MGKVTIAKWYVYELIDPRDGLVFYVGKGSGSRINGHENEARKSTGVCSEKVNRIKEIWEYGAEIERRHIAWFWDEQEAYDFEAERVAEYTLEALTNIYPGGGGARGYFVSRPRSVAPVDIAKALSAANVLGWLDLWLKSGKAKFEAVAASGWHGEIAKIVLNQVIPAWWPRIQADAAAMSVIRKAYKRDGAVFSYGCA